MDKIKELKERVKLVREANRIEKDRLKPKPNDLMADDIPERMASYDFWCDPCREDFKSPAIKTTYKLDGNKISTIRGECPECETIAIRYATHRDQDPYYNKSKSIRRSRNQFATELLSAEDYGFKTLYGLPYEQFMQRQMEREEEILAEERTIGLKGQSLEMKERLAKLLK